MERKKADVRKRMEEQSMAKKKKGFMTPERKKKLRVRTGVLYWGSTDPTRDPWRGSRGPMVAINVKQYITSLIRSIWS